VRQPIERVRSGFLQSGREKLFNVPPSRELARAMEEEAKALGNRLYSPLVTLRLAGEQELATGHACQDVVVRSASERAAPGESHVSASDFSTGPLIATLARDCRWGWWSEWLQMWANSSKSLEAA
jgi:hypothetical protein